MAGRSCLLAGCWLAWLADGCLLLLRSSATAMPWPELVLDLARSSTARCSQYDTLYVREDADLTSMHRSIINNIISAPPAHARPRGRRACVGRSVVRAWRARGAAACCLAPRAATRPAAAPLLRTTTADDSPTRSR